MIRVICLYILLKIFSYVGNGFLTQESIKMTHGGKNIRVIIVFSINVDNVYYLYKLYNFYKIYVSW